jgi:toxin ParE1/3/4
MRIVWSARSIERLRAIHDFVAVGSESRATDLLRQIFDAVDRLRMFPKSGRLIPEYEHIEVRELLVSAYRVLYREMDDSVEIVNVLHMRQQL